MPRSLFLILVTFVAIASVTSLYYTLLNHPTIYGSPSLVEYNIVALRINDTSIYTEYTKKITGIPPDNIVKTINILKKKGYRVETFIGMNKFILEKIILESKNNTVTITFKPSTSIILAYKKPPDYIVHSENYKFEIVNKTYRIIFNGEDITNKTILLPGTIEELSPEEETVLITLTNQSITSKNLTIGIQPCKDKEELLEYYKQTINNTGKHIEECRNDPKCIGACSKPYIVHVKNWPVLIRNKTTCCKIIDGINHCIIQSSIAKTCYKNTIITIQGSLETKTLLKLINNLIPKQ